MARWTESYQDMEHISKIASELPITAIIQVYLKTGECIEGLLRRLNVENNAGHGGVWRYRGEIEIETKDRQRYIIDYLDIKYVFAASTPELLKEYEDLGLITIVRLPNDKS